jgi:hypothetical protein
MSRKVLLGHQQKASSKQNRSGPSTPLLPPCPRRNIPHKDVGDNSQTIWFYLQIILKIPWGPSSAARARTKIQ